MPFLKRLCTMVAAGLLAATFSAGAATARGFDPTPMAHSYAGSWTVTVTGSQHSNWTGCLTLTGSGEASVVIGSQKYTGGSYFVVNNTLVATIGVEGYGQNAGLMFIGRASRSQLGAGAFEDVYGGGDFDSGALAFGMKGSC
jgi:hypothetical protein